MKKQKKQKLEINRVRIEGNQQEVRIDEEDGIEKIKVFIKNNSKGLIIGGLLGVMIGGFAVESYYEAEHKKRNKLECSSHKICHDCRDEHYMNALKSVEEGKEEIEDKLKKAAENMSNIFIEENKIQKDNQEMREINKTGQEAKDEEEITIDNFKEKVLDKNDFFKARGE